MTEPESVLSPRAQTIAVIVGAVTLLLSIGISSYGPLVWLIGVIIAVVVVVRKGRRLERALQIDHESRNTLSHVRSTRSGNFLRKFSTAAGMFSQRD